MLVWLASYPRSGNTLTRMLIHRAFGLPTRTIVGFEGDKNFSGKDGVLDLVGASTETTSYQDLIEQARNHDEVYIIKTHDAPLTDDPAIYVMRDGRSSVVSYFHFINEIGNYACGIEQVIRGDVYAGGWSDHIRAWSPATRKNTLTVRFEDLVADPSSSLQSVGSFLGVPQVGVCALDFNDLHSRFPEFFRTGSNAENIRELELSGFSDLFDEFHSSMMRHYGYYR